MEGAPQHLEARQVLIPRPAPASSRDAKARRSSVERHPLSAIESIDLTLHLPVEEPFEGVSPPLPGAPSCAAERPPAY